MYGFFLCSILASRRKFKFRFSNFKPELSTLFLYFFVLIYKKITYGTSMIIELPFKTTELPAGFDEAGRGALAGPVVSAVVIFKENFDLIGLDDSKKLSHKERVELSKEIKEFALAYGIGYASHKVIDKENILQASLISMAKALQDLIQKSHILPKNLLIDGTQKIPLPYFPTYAPSYSLEPSQQAIIDGDALVPVISAASVLAKVTRDEIMTNLDKVYPQYQFAKHMGYGSKVHREAILEFEPCPIHRKTFKGVRKEQKQASLFDF